MKTFLEFIVEGAAVPERQQFIDSLNKSSLSPEEKTAAIKKWDEEPTNWTKGKIDPEKLKRDAEIETNIKNGPQIRAEPEQSFGQQYTQASRNLSMADPLAAEIGLGHRGGPKGTPTVGALHGLAASSAASTLGRIGTAAITSPLNFATQTAVDMALSSGIHKSVNTALNAVSPEPSMWKDVISSSLSMIPWGSPVRGEALKSATKMMGLGAGGAILQNYADPAGKIASDLVPNQSSQFISRKDAADIQQKKQQAAYDTVGGTMYNYGNYLPMLGPKGAAIPTAISTVKGLYDYLTADVDSTKSNKK